MALNYRISEKELTCDRNHLIRSGSYFQLTLFARGHCQASFHHKTYPCSGAEMILMFPGETVTLENQEKASSSRYVTLKIAEDTLAALSDDTLSFPDKFRFVPYQVAVIHADLKTCALLGNLLNQLRKPMADTLALGHNLYEKSMLTTFLILFLRACIQSDAVHRRNLQKELIIDDVFRYISHHLEDDLTLQTLADEFYVSKEHLSRKFKKTVGMTIHTYITRLRIDLSKKYLIQGLRVSDVYARCGFQSYNHFFRVFKKACGMTPHEYAASGLTSFLSHT